MKKTILLLMLFLSTSFLYAEDKRYNIPLGDSPATGPKDAPVTIFEFLDYQ